MAEEGRGDWERRGREEGENGRREDGAKSGFGNGKAGAGHLLHSKSPRLQFLPLRLAAIVLDDPEAPDRLAAIVLGDPGVPDRLAAIVLSDPEASDRLAANRLDDPGARLLFPKSPRLPVLLLQCHAPFHEQDAAREMVEDS